MFRRSMIVMASAAAVASCTPGPPALKALSKEAPPPVTGKITRLLIWLPSDDSGADAKVMAVQFTAKLKALSIPIQVGRSTALELDRSDDQKPFIAGFKPSHRLEIDVLAALKIQGLAAAAVPSRAFLKVALYEGTEKMPLRSFSYGPSARFGGEFADTIVAKLKEDGLL